ncbi:MAG: ATP phosphoribosyltransferase regulatory subunit [Deltaproteobacteria bacterium]|nr:ATP phosphoribosyltransferase regulatory subunit [Deltaproteobacteria bacterium]
MSAKHEWLNLLEVSGPFLAVPVLREVFPQGLEELDSSRAKRLRSAYEEWRDAVDGDDADRDKLHAAWIDEVLRTALEADDQLLTAGEDVPASIVELPEHDTAIAPEFVFVDPTHGAAVLAPVHVFPPDTDLSASMKFGGLSCSAGDRMALHLRALNVPFGIVTNGERWMLVHAPTGEVATFASWYARIWGQEPATLRAFKSLLGVRRFLAPAQDRLPALFERSLKHQDEVTDALGDQVRRAIEVLVQALDRADQDRNRELLRDVKPQELYEAGLTVMMRLVFLLAAEERGLLLLGEPRYDSFYAVSTLRMQLRAESDEILERRRASWSRLLAVFRAVFGGIDHPTLRLPAMGGSLFDPDRFPFLEGRLKGTSWRQHRAEPLPVDDRTVLLLLEAIQTFEGRTLSYRALDVEQIGHVYEGLLERTVSRVEDVTLELEAGAQAKDARVTLGELESARLDGQAAVTSLLVERSKRSESAIKNALAAEVEPQQNARLLSACRGDVKLRDRLAPYVRLMRTDPWGYPLVHPKGAFVVVLGADRRETGTHYTPKSLTERIVEETLTPLVYDGPAKGAPRAEWKLKTPEQLLELKVCDPAMGSGAFLVQACRFLSARIVEAWAIEEAAGRVVDLTGQVHEPRTSVECMPPSVEARAENARRIVAERCLYGVDLNPLAVELAKLSLWLVTLSKGRPFGFLDHNLRRGDSLLGISRLEQLTELSMAPKEQTQGRLFGKNVRQAVEEALAIRLQLREMPIRDIRDVEAMASLDAVAREKLRVSEELADAFIATVFAAESDRVLESRLAGFAVEADRIVKSNEESLEALRRRATSDLAIDAPNGAPRTTFHWPLEFPEVFQRADAGFDAVVGNPPFMGGRLLGRRLGMAYQEYLKLIRNGIAGSPDLCAYFFLRAFALVRSSGAFGLLATKSVTETGSRVVCLDQIISAGGHIYAANSRFPWPGRASVVVSIVWVTRTWNGTIRLDDKHVRAIDGALEEDAQLGRPVKLKALKGRFSQGQDLMGRGFELDAAERETLLNKDAACAEVVLPLYNGQDLNTMPVLAPRRWAIYFRDWDEAKARQFGPAFSRVEELVKPYRDSLTGQIHQDCFWKFWDLRPGLLREFQRLRHVLAISQNTKHLCVSRVPTNAVYNHKVKILFFESFAELATLQSSIHDVWARWCSSTLGASTLSYSTSAVLEPWPMPTMTEGLERVGEDYSTLRDGIRRDETVGLTDLYNRFHDPSDTSPRIVKLRSLHRDMDLAVLHAYEWDDIDLALDFREVSYLPENDRVRFTVSEGARAELLKRLVALNHERHAQEAASGTKPGSAKGRAKKAAPAGQGALALDASAPAKRGKRGGR